MMTMTMRGLRCILLRKMTAHELLLSTLCLLSVYIRPKCVAVGDLTNSKEDVSLIHYLFVYTRPK